MPTFTYSVSRSPGQDSSTWSASTQETSLHPKIQQEQLVPTSMTECLGCWQCSKLQAKPGHPGSGYRLEGLGGLWSQRDWVTGPTEHSPRASQDSYTPKSTHYPTCFRSPQEPPGSVQGWPRAQRNKGPRRPSACLSQDLKWPEKGTQVTQEPGRGSASLVDHRSQRRVLPPSLPPPPHRVEQQP